MKRIDIEKARPGDIILTASPTKLSKSIRMATLGSVSHAMICVQFGSAIDSTDLGVQAWNLQRNFFQDDEKVFVFRLRSPPSATNLTQILDFARSEIGTRYSKAEAARTVLPGPKPRTNRQFCSRLVARAFRHGGIELVPDADYCSPDDLKQSELLVELTDCVVQASDAEVLAQSSEFNPIEAMQNAQNYVLGVARGLDATVENLQDLDRLIRRRPEWDDEIVKAYKESGYLDLWKHEVRKHPWRYDTDTMDAFTNDDRMHDLREYCIATIKEAFSGGTRFAVNLAHYEEQNRTEPRKMLSLLIALYQTLVKNDEDRRNVAHQWLLARYPDDVSKHLERIQPYSDLWFLIVGRVEPMLAHLARGAISKHQSKEVCCSCGDHPTSDYRIANSAEAMPGVPSLRLCDDCALIRSKRGEHLEKWS